MRTSQTLRVLTACLAFAGLQPLEVWLGMTEESRSWPLTACNLSGGLRFHAALRSGLSLHLPTGRSLSVPQSFRAIVGITWSNAITGPARGAVLLTLILVVNFSVFGLTPRKARPRRSMDGRRNAPATQGAAGCASACRQSSRISATCSARSWSSASARRPVTIADRQPATCAASAPAFNSETISGTQASYSSRAAGSPAMPTGSQR